MCATMKILIHFRPFISQSLDNQDALAGVRHYAHLHNWHVQTVNRPAPAEIPSLLAFWKPLGCIVESELGPAEYPPSLFGKTPVVYLDPGSKAIQNVFCTLDDPQATISLAARELLSLGLANYAFVPYFRPISWSLDRETEFRKILKLNGLRVHVFQSDETGPTPAWIQQLGTWIRELPKPCALLAVNDIVGESVVNTASAQGIAVPDNLAVVSIDNSKTICENTNPPLTSVALDFFRAGFLSAELLAEKLAKPHLKPCCRYYPPIAIIRRASSRRFNYQDNRVVTALKLINGENFNTLTSSQIISAMGCSRRLAEIRFRDMTGMSILEAIQKVRLERACALLKTTRLTNNEIANLCGYSKDFFLQKLFRKHFNKTMSEFRR